MTDLKPCPFCGGEAVSVGWSDFDSGMIFIECGSCGMYCEPKDCYADEQKAIAAWNTRLEHISDDGWEYDKHSVPATEENMAKFGWVRERTCEIEHVKGGARYDVWRCSACGYEYAESVSETSVVQNYCPNCGCKVVGE